jgi:hypothetical protein
MWRVLIGAQIMAERAQSWHNVPEYTGALAAAFRPYWTDRELWQAT